MGLSKPRIHSFTHLPTRLSKSQYEAGIQIIAFEEDGVSSCPEAVKYLLRTIAVQPH